MSHRCRPGPILLLLLLLLVGLVMAGAAGCAGGGGTAAGPSGGSATTSPTGATSNPTATAANPTTPTSIDAEPAPTGPGSPELLFFLRDGKVAVGDRPVIDAPDLPRATLERLIQGPPKAATDAGLTTSVPRGTQIRRLTIDGEVATVDLNRAFETADTRPQVAQVTYTLTQFPGVRRVKFLVEGTDNGATGVPPIARTDLAAFTPEVLLESPWPGATATRAVKVSGDLDPGLKGFDYRIDAGGQVVAKGTVNARLGAASRKRFDQSVEIPAGTTGPATFVVLAPDGGPRRDLSVPMTLG